MFESIAIVGATGAVGSLIRQMLEERDFPYKKITFLASKNSAGKTITFKLTGPPVTHAILLYARSLAPQNTAGGLLFLNNQDLRREVKTTDPSGIVQWDIRLDHTDSWFNVGSDVYFQGLSPRMLTSDWLKITVLP